ncbi:MAG: YunC family protein [Tuberibacillus sp.]
MIKVEPMFIEGKPFTAVTVELPKTKLMAVFNETGYIMCGALDVGLLNEKLKSRKIIAGRAVGVRTIDELLNAPLESVTIEAENLGITKGMIGCEALLKMDL